MNRRLFVTTSLSLSLMGCTAPLWSIMPTEEFVIGAWNVTGRKLQDVIVRDASRPEIWWFSQLVQHPHPAWPNVPPAHIPAFGGDHRSGRIPDAVTVQWRDLPPPDATPYTGTLHGPFTVANIRSRIPPDILRMARLDKYVIHISVSSGVVPVLFNWKLVYFAGGGMGIKEIARGGDSVK